MTEINPAGNKSLSFNISAKKIGENKKSRSAPEEVEASISSENIRDRLPHINESKLSLSKKTDGANLPPAFSTSKKPVPVIEEKQIEKDATFFRELDAGDNDREIGKLYDGIFESHEPSSKPLKSESTPQVDADDIDLTVPARLKGIETPFEEYSDTVRKEQLSSIDALKSPDVCWHDPEGLKEKVDGAGKLTPFWGDTVVVRTGKKETALATAVQKRVIEAVPDVFAKPLDPATFHITIHDLDNAPDKTDKLEDKMQGNKANCHKIFEELAGYFKKHPDQAVVKLKPSLVCPDATVSIGFLPATEKDYRTIMNLRNQFDKVVNLDNWLRMHISLCYFKPAPFSSEQRQKLHAVLHEVNKDLDLPVELDFRKLVYQRFNNMNSYHDKFSVSDCIK
ncbi:MAG: hypothetical protein K8T10_13455 [Candidatus Eremiobacteraeota bacterium]|nr:hypothetical protein [Candidatus Eremiobacteraeota bacterium]